MIIETIFSTTDAEGNPNFAPMGLLLGKEYVTVRPYRNTQTCRNLLETGCGVANITDNVLAYVQTALYDAVLPYNPARVVRGIVFIQACSWREVELVDAGGTEDRAELRCRVVHTESRRDFLGFCRAANAVIEAAILATRLDSYDGKIVNEKMIGFDTIVDKTGSLLEKEAMKLVWEYIRKEEAE
jgi:hypothetical protein